MARGRRIDHDEQKMLLKELACRGPWYYNWETQSMEKAGQAGPREAAPYETPPVNGECLTLMRLPISKPSLKPSL